MSLRFSRLGRTLRRYGKRFNVWPNLQEWLQWRYRWSALISPKGLYPRGKSARGKVPLAARSGPGLYPARAYPSWSGGCSGQGPAGNAEHMPHGHRAIPPVGCASQGDVPSRRRCLCVSFGPAGPHVAWRRGGWSLDLENWRRVGGVRFLYSINWVIARNEW